MAHITPSFLLALALAVTLQVCGSLADSNLVTELKALDDCTIYSVRHPEFYLSLYCPLRVNYRLQLRKGNPRESDDGKSTSGRWKINIQENTSSGNNTRVQLWNYFAERNLEYYESENVISTKVGYRRWSSDGKNNWLVNIKSGGLTSEGIVTPIRLDFSPDQYLHAANDEDITIKDTVVDNTGLWRVSCKKQE
ncbi:uncharacterized protein LOC132200831 [Neocloeon triangulifer]|uniref:uncharacterized protein LOC132200831 n=1 Tax=Neocloeon triangulifer TaxID=2078957 RepID=UPI00286ECA88|nr:uncharacterized protein LOC132200831 [Neocloeon triangulifer]